jgi:dihydroorotate dehydrogenase electron transfer subunit
MNHHYQLKIISLKEVAMGLFRLVFQSPQLANESKPGQFLMVDCNVGIASTENLFLRRPLAVHRTNIKEGQLSILFQVVGKGTLALSKATAGDVIDVIGPLGKPIEIDSSVENIVFVSGGLGIASLTALMDVASERNLKITLLSGARNSYRLYPTQLLPEGVIEMTATDDGSAGIRAPITHLVSQVQENADIIYACGPLPMLEALSQMRTDGMLAVDTIGLLESQMACGIGLCKGCVVDTDSGTKLICVDGPAFNLREVIWESQYTP